MKAREIHLATRDQKTAMDELDDTVGQVAGEIGAVVGRSVFAQTAGYEDLGKTVGQGQLYVGVGLVVTQQDIEARLALLDQVVFKRQGLVFVGYEDIVQIDGLAHQRAGFGVGLRSLQKIGANPGAKVLGLAHVNDFAFGVLVEVYAGLGGECADFLVEVHGTVWFTRRLGPDASS